MVTSGRVILTACLLTVLIVPARAQMPSPTIEDEPAQISEHVWALRGFPNIGIVVGTRATLVVDTGLGAKNGAAVAAVAARLSPKSAMLFLTSTHFHPEHAAGEPGFPHGTILIRDAVQQREMDAHGEELLNMFRAMSAENKALLTGPPLRTPDVIFDRAVTLDLGGVTARLLWLGAAHTRGDELTLVEPDGTLISGDVVQNDTAPIIFGDGGTPASWLAVLKQIADLKVRHVLPDHSEPGDGTLVTRELALIGEIRDRALALKAQRTSAEAAGAAIDAQLKREHPRWQADPMAGGQIADFVKRVYQEH